MQPRAGAIGSWIFMAGMIMVNSLANITAWLVAHEWTGFGLEPSTWSMIMILTATLLGLLFGRVRRDAAFALVVSWALFGIYRGQGEAYPWIGYVSAASGILLVGVVGLRKFVLPTK
jgi:translocator protein